MSPTSRRIFLYWLLLLVPTLVVGIGSVQLLRMEKARIAEQGGYAADARRATVGARARLVVENIELLVGDVQNGVLDTLVAETAEPLPAFLGEWPKTNPLVKTGFIAREDGRLVWPRADAPDSDARGFARRFTQAVQPRLPWRESADAAPKLKRERSAETVQAEVARRSITSNVAQVQSARRDVQQLFQPRTVDIGSANANRAGTSDKITLAAPTARAKAMDRDALGGVTGAAPAAAPASEGAAPPSAAAGKPAGSVAAATGRRGWFPFLVEGHLHVLGWVQPDEDANIRGVELDLGALISRLGSALPTQVDPGEGYALRDDHGRVVHQAGLVRDGAIPVVQVPVAEALLPGWTLVGFLDSARLSSMGGTAFFWGGVLLISLFVAAILAGGSLLLRQARRSEIEAVQKTSFVANVSHEFKTPLTTIRLYSELLEEGRVRDETQGREYLRTIGRETQRLARLVNNVLDFSRLEQGRKKFAPEELDLAQELTRLLDTHAPRIAEAGLRLERRVPVAPLTARTDRDAFEQIVLNLIDNACKYAAEGGELLVTLSHPAGAAAELRVSDRGPGVPAAHRERIFEKFHRVDQSLTAEKNGAGLGLSIARQLARGLGGDLRYAPRDGGGAEFILTLP